MHIKTKLLALLCAATLVGCGTNSVVDTTDSSSISTTISTESSVDTSSEGTDSKEEIVEDAVTPIDDSSNSSKETKITTSLDSTITKEVTTSKTATSTVSETTTTTVSETTTNTTAPTQTEVNTSAQSENITWPVLETPVETEIVTKETTAKTTPEPEYEEEETYSSEIDSYSYQLLAEIVWHEAGSDWLSQYDKAHIAAAVMNRVYDSRFPNTVYDVLVVPGQFTGYWPGCCSPTQACYDAVDYYLANPYDFDGANSWWGDGQLNHFYYQ